MAAAYTPHVMPALALARSGRPQPLVPIRPGHSRSTHRVLNWPFEAGRGTSARRSPHVNGTAGAVPKLTMLSDPSQWDGDGARGP
jgi:hypothetical protein